MIEPISVGIEPRHIAAGVWVDLSLQVVNGGDDPLDDVVITLKPPWQLSVKNSKLGVAHLAPHATGRVSASFKASLSAPPSLDFAADVHYRLAGKVHTPTVQLHLEVQPKVEVRSEKPKNRAADSDEVISLKRQLAIHQRNLRTLEEQKAKYGSLDVPLRIVNEIAEQEEAIARLQARLAQIEGTAPDASPADRPGTTYNIHIEQASGLAIGDGARMVPAAAADQFPADSSRRQILDQRRRELQAQWDAMTERIQAIQRDLAVETDGERKYTLNRRIDRLQAERDQVAARDREQITPTEQGEPDAPSARFGDDQSSGQTVDIQKLRLDAAVPENAHLNRTFDLAVTVRRLSSPLLKQNDLTYIRSGDAQVVWPKSVAYIHLRVQINAPECDIHGPDGYSFYLYADQDSPIFYFKLTPRKLGDITVIVGLFQEDDWLGSARVRTFVRRRAVGSVKMVISSDSFASEQDQRCTDLAEGIREMLELIKQYEDQRRLTDDPKAKRRAEREIADLRRQLAAYEAEARDLGCE
jgi:hypothetical protein